MGTGRLSRQREHGAAGLDRKSCHDVATPADGAAIEHVPSADPSSAVTIPASRTSSKCLRSVCLLTSVFGPHCGV